MNKGIQINIQSIMLSGYGHGKTLSPFNFPHELKDFWNPVFLFAWIVSQIIQLTLCWQINMYEDFFKILHLWFDKS